MAKYESVIYPLDEQSKIHDVPLKIATEEVVRDYGRLVPDFEKEEVWIETWPKQGWREVAPGSGNHGGITEGDYVYDWKDGLLEAKNRAVGMGFTIARVATGVSDSHRTHAVSWEFNYHPDSGQVFFPRNKSPFVALLALPGDDVKPEDFVGLYFDGSCGFQLKPNVWHQAMLPLSNTAEFKNKQGRVFACVPVDMVKEFGMFLRVPLMKEFAQ